MQWGVLVTEPQRHRIATETLADHGFEFFMPWRELVRISRGRHHRTLIPYFGRYVFVTLCEAWERLPSLRGVSSMLLHSETLLPWRVDSCELDAIRVLCDERGVVREEQRIDDGLHYGDLVYVELGPFANLRGVYDCRIGKHREAATFVMFGREQRVMFRCGELKKLES
jgi:transcription antitermination factor NusG